MEKNLKAHLFVCTNVREGGKKSCGASGSGELRESLKKICKDEPYHSVVRVNSAGCLGRCADGIAVVMYPKGEWFTNLKADDTAKIHAALDQVVRG